jgi:hypothetical protein
LDKQADIPIFSTETPCFNLLHIAGRHVGFFEFKHTQIMSEMLLFKKAPAMVAALLFLTASIYAQAPAIEWQKAYGGFDADFMNVVVGTTDGGYFFAGDSYSSITGNKTENSNGTTDFWVIKTDAVGNIEWQNTIGGSAYDVLYDGHQTPDGGYIIGGYSSSGISGDKTESNLGEQDYWVLKLSSSGTIEWQNSLRTNKNDMCTSLHPTSDGGYIVGGFSSGGINGDKTTASKGLDDFWILKLDALGNISWQKTIGGSSTDMLVTIRQTTDGGYIVGGSSISNASADKSENSNGAYDYWIMKLNTTGNIVWQNTIGGNDMDALSDVIQTNDGGFLVAGYSLSGISGDKSEPNLGQDDYWIVKLNSSGNIEWENTIGGTARDILTGIHQMADNGYVISGYSNSGISGDKTENTYGGFSYGDYWIIKIDELGNIIWQNSIGGNGEDISGAAEVNPDGSIVIAGTSMSAVSGDKTETFYGIADFWAIKLETDCVAEDEICNGIDDDCNGLVDDDIAMFAVAYPDGATTVCQGNTVLLIAEYSGDAVQWTRNGANIAGATSDTYLANKTGMYAINTSSECGDVTSGPVSVTVNKNPNATIAAAGPTTFCPGGNVTLNVTPVAGCTYQWYKGASALLGATGLSYTATTSGNYKCNVTKVSTGCSKMSNTIPVSVTCKSGTLIEDHIILYPNPATTTLNIETQNDNEKTISVTDMIGQEVMTINSNEQLISLQITYLPAGTYFITIIENNAVSTHQFIKQ